MIIVFRVKQLVSALAPTTTSREHRTRSYYVLARSDVSIARASAPVPYHW